MKTAFLNAFKLIPGIAVAVMIAAVAWFIEGLMPVHVIGAAVSVLVIEGSLTLLAAAVQPVLTDSVIAHMSVIGSLLIIALSLNVTQFLR